MTVEYSKAVLRKQDKRYSVEAECTVSGHAVQKIVWFHQNTRIDPVNRTSVRVKDSLQHGLFAYGQTQAVHSVLQVLLPIKTLNCKYLTTFKDYTCSTRGLLDNQDFGTMSLECKKHRFH